MALELTRDITYRGIDFHPTEPWVLITLHSGKTIIESCRFFFKLPKIASVRRNSSNSLDTSNRAEKWNWMLSMNTRADSTFT